MTVALSGPWVLAIPFTVAIIAVFAWLLWSRPARPPQFQGYTVRRGWQVDPLSLLERDLQEGRLTAGILTVRDRLEHLLTERYSLTPPEIHEIFIRADRSPEVVRACREVRALESTAAIASRVEDPRRTDLWSRWRRPVWRKRAYERFRTELSEIESLWPALEGAS